MGPIKTSTFTVNKPEKKLGVNVNAIESVGAKFELINKFIEAGKEIPAELTKNFIIVPLSDNPYSEIE